MRDLARILAVAVGVLTACASWHGSARLCAAEPALNAAAAQPSPPRELLSAAEWNALDASTDRGLEFLSKKQRPDGSFEAPGPGQPAITSLCVMAFLSRGHIPHEGRYGAALERAIDFVLDSQQPSGLLCSLPVGAKLVNDTPSQTGSYNHAIAGLMLGEVYGMTAVKQRERIQVAIEAALRFTREQQLRPKKTRADVGGWRYLVQDPHFRNSSDLSVTSWHVMFLRSARNAEFDVPKEFIDDAMGYVHRAFMPEQGSFTYGQNPKGDRVTRAMAGSGILMLSLGGEHQTEMARSAGKWILRHPFSRYNEPGLVGERFHYSAYYCSQAMFQLGDEYWAAFYPPLMRMLVQHQHGDGSWDPETLRDGRYGNVYTTALSVLALTPPYQLLPIYQR